MQSIADTVANSHLIEEVRHRLDVWRSEHAGRQPLPPELWSEAAQLAQEYGAQRIAKALRLSYYSLKQHLPASAAVGAKGEKKPAKFVELPPWNSSMVPECSLELENARGAKMKIELRGAGVGELSNLTRLFWREL
jgi:hypothetical protein